MKPKVTVGAGKTLLLQRWLQAKEGWPLHGTLLGFGPTDSSHPGRQSLGEDGKVPVSAGSPPPAGTVLTCMHCAHTHTHTPCCRFWHWAALGWTPIPAPSGGVVGRQDIRQKLLLVARHRHQAWGSLLARRRSVIKL